MKRTLVILSVVLVLSGAAFILFLEASNPCNARTIGDIPAPFGYDREEADKGSYPEFLRSLPLKKRGSKVMLFTGGRARLQFLSAAVVDLPLISNDEQCADITMRMRAEYLWMKGRYNDLKFTGLNGKTIAYHEGDTRSSFESWLKTVYANCNTTSVFNETRERPLDEIQSGDILVYKSRKKGYYGHAILVADVARGRGGKVAVLCVEGNTPAREAHIVRNPNPFHNPWHIIREGEGYQISVFHFYKNELRHY